MTEPADPSAAAAVDRRYRFLAEISPVQLWTSLPDGKLDYVTDQTARRLGLTPERLLADGWQHVVHPDDLPRAIERWTHALMTGEPYEVEFRLRLADGQYAWHLVRAQAQRDDAGEIVRWFGTNTNIEAEREQQRRIEALLREVELASRAKDEFLATASHELRTPLNAILGWAQLLRGGASDAAGLARGLETIERNARAQVRLIEDLLDASRIITGKLHLEVRAIDLNVVVNAAIDAVRPAAVARSIRLDVTLDPDAAEITGDPDRLQQVVWNLVNNAIKFTPSGGNVEVRARRAGANVEVSVRDDGQGIEANLLPYVFDRFRQGDSRSTRRHGGLGLGLALVRHLVEAHGGSVRAESEGEGRGAVFTVEVPVLAVVGEAVPSPRPTTAPVAEVAGPRVLRGIRVLIVDDELDARELVATLLRAHAGEVVIAGSVAEAVAWLRQHTPQVLVTDIGMPGTDGYALLSQVRALDGEVATVPAIALTAYAGERDRRRAADSGFQGYLAKPVDPNALVRLVAELARGGAASSRR